MNSAIDNAEAVRRVARHFVNRYGQIVPSLTVEDLIQVGLIELWRAGRSGTRPMVYNRMIDLLRREGALANRHDGKAAKRRPLLLTLEPPAGFRHDGRSDDLAFVARDPDPSEVAAARELWAMLEARPRSIERDATRLRLAGHSACEAARKLGTTPTSVDTSKSCFLRRWRRELLGANRN